MAACAAPSHSRRVAVLGGGIIGLSCAWRLAAAGHEVTLFDPAVGGGATYAAAGMVAPASEAVFGQDALLAVGLESALRWPRFALDLAHDAGCVLELAPRGVLLVALDAEDEVVLGRHARHVERRGCHVERLTSRSARRLEPALSPRVTGAVLLRESAVDPRAVSDALAKAFIARGGTVLPVAAEPVVRDGSVRAVRAVTDLPGGAEAGAGAGRQLEVDDVVVAAGWRSPASLTMLPHPVRVHPLKGQVVRLGVPPGTLGHTVRASVRGRDVYVVPRPGGELVVGATSEDVGADLTVTAGAVHDLLHDAIAVIPVIAEAELRESTARLRPATVDNLPLVGPTCIEGLMVATGHGRDGILLAPLSAEAMLAHVERRSPPRGADVLAAQRLCVPEEHS